MVAMWCVSESHVSQTVTVSLSQLSRSQVIKAVSEEDTEQQGADSLALGDATSLCTIMASAAFRSTKPGVLKHTVSRSPQCKLRELGVRSKIVYCGPMSQTKIDRD